ncbi:response regulator [Rhizobium cauense]|uniref:response regulator n=1 Tax=Rhizobium cauense TaxID=1166683 RepID=UPI001C6E7CB1|nr:response regulator [Rhizobium cauense]MBW9117335.1 response regulator [Rhizobium cauense]
MLFADLIGKNVLIVEDDSLQASAMRVAMEYQGSQVVGPFPDLDDGFAALEQKPVDIAILDVSLNAQKVFPLADELTERGIPFVFVTGYDRHFLPPRFQKSACVVKPLGDEDLAFAVAISIIGARNGGSNRAKDIT